MPSYVLILYNKEKRQIAVGSLGKITFYPGYFYYVGNANCGMHRIKRHFGSQKKRKKIRWHIDYISSSMNIIGAILTPLNECELASKFEKYRSIPNFGCSDCSCNSHLFYSPILTLEFLSA